MGAGLKIASIKSSDKARKEQRSVNRKKEAQSRLSSARDAMAQVRQTRIAQAQIIQGAATNGTQSSSAAGSLTSGNMQFLNQMDNINSQISSHLNKASLYGQQAGLYNAGADLVVDLAKGGK